MQSPVWLMLAEITYAIVIFNGATRVNLRVLRGRMQLPGRLLVIGLPLSILLGSLAAAVLLFGIWPAPLTEIMHASVGNLLEHVSVSKLPAETGLALMGTTP